MSSFFQKLHGISSSSAVKTKTLPPQPSSRLKQTNVETSARPTITKQKLQTPVVTANKPVVPTGRSNRPASRPIPVTVTARPRPENVPPMRRTQSSSAPHTPTTRKRRPSPLSIGRIAKTHDASRVASLATPSSTDMKRRRTASPAYRIPRSSSDDETDFSEPVVLFRSETPDIVHYHPVERAMLNPRAGEDVDFMHAKELVCVVDKDSFFAETEDNPALEVVIQLPFAEERYFLRWYAANVEIQIVTTEKAGRISSYRRHCRYGISPPGTFPPSGRPSRRYDTTRLHLSDK